MKKAISLLLSCVVLISIFSIGVSAAGDTLLESSVEILENGDKIVTELYKPVIQPRTGVKGYKTATYYSAASVAIWAVTVNGSFSYNKGVSSKATDSTATVKVYSSNASFSSKNASTSGKTATASAVVYYNTYKTSKSVSVSCDNYGKIY